MLLFAQPKMLSTIPIKTTIGQQPLKCEGIVWLNILWLGGVSKIIIVVLQYAVADVASRTLDAVAHIICEIAHSFVLHHQDCPDF